MNQIFGDTGAGVLRNVDLDHRVATVTHPSEIVEHPGLSVAEKRAILAAWASDACAVEGAPALRQLDSGAIVRIDDILDALRALDSSDERAKPVQPAPRLPFARRRGRLAERLRGRAFRSGRRDDDDDPPPSPAAMAWPVRPSFVTACAAH